MPLDHACLAIPKAKFAEAVEWYTKALEPLGYKKIMEFPASAAGFGDPQPDFWLLATDKENVDGLHFAFKAKDRAAVDAYYKAALAAGGKDNGAPGVRKDYGPNYYASFVHDIFGYNIEAVCRLEAKGE